MSTSDPSQDTSRAAPAPSQPSLLGESPGAVPTAKAADASTRMLNKIQPSSSHSKSGPWRTLAVWVGAAALVLAAGAAWWSQQRSVVTPKPTVVAQPSKAPSVAASTSKPIESPSRSNAVAGTGAGAGAGAGASAVASAVAASAPSQVAPTAARIETVAAATVPAAAAASITSAPQKTVVSAAPPAAKRQAAKKTKSAKSAQTAKQRKQAQQQLAKAKQKSVPSAATARVVQGTPTVKSTSAAGATSASKEADVLLLGALLAHVSRDAQGAPPGTQAQQTIAQIVQRCEARGGKDTAETIECRRRICDGYWGKAQACPANLAPKKE